MKDLKYIGTDLENAIFNGFSSQINELKRLLCVRHLQINDKKKLSDLNTSKNGAAIILADIYVQNYVSVNPIQNWGWGGKKATLYQFFPCNFYKRSN